jgi:hypothetical protein
MPIPRYYRLSTSTGTNCPHDKGKLSESLQVIVELKRVLKEDAGLELNNAKTAILPKDITQQAIFDVVLTVL